MSRGSLTNIVKQEKSKISLRRRLDMACHIAKIDDMGIARVMEENNQLTIVDCGPYMPPEFITGKYDQSLDIFTFGLTLNYLFTKKQHQAIQFIITKVKLVEQSPIFSELIARCTHDDPSQRPSAIEIETT